MFELLHLPLVTGLLSSLANYNKKTVMIRTFDILQKYKYVCIYVLQCNQIYLDKTGSSTVFVIANLLQVNSERHTIYKSHNVIGLEKVTEGRKGQSSRGRRDGEGRQEGFRPIGQAQSQGARPGRGESRGN